MPKFHFTLQAKKDLREIKDYIALDNPIAATRYMGILKEKMQILAEYPGLGIKREEYIGLLKFPVGNYLIFSAHQRRALK
ncbi:hypothetical protein MTYM_01449 [Methylococcales bacterium]|nr:hypothetical protein MTYM_01449 [Methylococcales bacterium]